MDTTAPATIAKEDKLIATVHRRSCDGYGQMRGIYCVERPQNKFPEQPELPTIGAISKKLIDSINKNTLAKLNLSVWINITSVIQWFINFDIVEFYPSIS